MAKHRGLLARLLATDWTIYATRAFVVGSNLVSLLLIALLMQPQEFGVFVFAFSAALTLSAVISIGAPALLLRELSAAKSRGHMNIPRRQFFQLVFVWPALIMAFSTISAIGALRLLPDLLSASGVSVWLMVLTALVAGLINSVNVLASFFRAEGYVAVAMIFRDATPQVALLVATLVTMLVVQPDPIAVFAVGAIVLCLTLFLGILFLRNTLWDQVKKLPVRHERASISGFWGTSVTNMAWTQVDILIGGLFLSAATLGEYQVIKRIANFANMPQIVANWAVVVGVGKAFAEKQNEKIQRQASKAIRLSIAPLLVLNVALIGFAPFILDWFGISMDAASWALLILLLIASTTNVLFGANFVVASQCKMEKIALVARLIGLVSCACLLIVTKPDDPRIVATTYVFGTLLSNAWLWRRIYNVLEVDTSIMAFQRRTRKFI